MKNLSIAVPVYNTAPWLPRCLRSVLVDEALEDIELICVNDGSRDDSLALLRQYEKEYPQTLLVIDKENGGHGSAVNAALAAAAGRYFRVLDSDDWFDTPAFLRYLQQLKACSEDLVVTPYTQELTETGAELRYDYDYVRPGRVYTAHEIPSGPDRQYFTMAASTWKTSLLRKCGLQLLEKCSYVDMQYNAWPVPALEGQSMSRENLQRNVLQHQRVFCTIVEYYAAVKADLTAAQRAYLEQMLAFFYYSHIHLLQEMQGKRKRIKSLERWLSSISPTLYDRVSFPALRLSRTVSYLDLSLPTPIRRVGCRVLRLMS